MSAASSSSRCPYTRHSSETARPARASANGNEYRTTTDWIAGLASTAITASSKLRATIVS